MQSGSASGARLAAAIKNRDPGAPRPSPATLAHGHEGDTGAPDVLAPRHLAPADLSGAVPPELLGKPHAETATDPS